MIAPLLLALDRARDSPVATTRRRLTSGPRKTPTTAAPTSCTCARLGWRRDRRWWTASSTSRSGRRRRCSPASASFRRTTAQPPTTPPKCSCGTRRRRFTSASAPSSGTARRAPRWPTATRSTSDDNVQILLGTFNDGRQATVFAVNPLGVQADGTIVESNQTRSSGFGGTTLARDPGRPQRRLRVSIEGRGDAGGLRRRSAHSVQEPEVSVGRRAVVGTQHRARRSSTRGTRTAGRRRAARVCRSSRSPARSTG